MASAASNRALAHVFAAVINLRAALSFSNPSVSALAASHGSQASPSRFRQFDRQRG
jgi:hypothetical protein